MTDAPTPPPTPERPDADRSATRWSLIAGIVLIVAAVLAVLFVVVDTGDDDTGDSVPASETTASASSTVETTEAPPTTEAAVTTDAVATTAPATSEVPPLPDDLRPAIWPWAQTDTRYGDPVEAATAFATDFLGFADPIVGEFMAGDNRSGEVEIRAVDTGPSTIVFVRQLTDDDSWWILGAASENITIDEPQTGDDVTSPLTVSGTASAFEGTVDVELRADGNGEPIFEGFVTASGAPEPGPFSETFAFTSPGDFGGALVMLSRSSEDGSPIEASALRIYYR